MKNHDLMDDIISQAMLDNTRNFLSLMTVGDPILFTITHLDSIFVGYVLQDRTIIKNNERADIREVFLGKTSIDSVLDVIDKKLPVYDLLKNSTEKCRIGKVGHKVFPKKTVNQINEVENSIPKPSFYLDVSLSEDPNYIFMKLRSKKYRLNDMNYSDPSRESTNIIEKYRNTVPTNLNNPYFDFEKIY